MALLVAQRSELILIVIAVTSTKNHLNIQNAYKIESLVVNCFESTHLLEPMSHKCNYLGISDLLLIYPIRLLVRSSFESVEATRLAVWIIVTLWNLTGVYIFASRQNVTLMGIRVWISSYIIITDWGVIAHSCCKFKDGLTPQSLNVWLGWVNASLEKLELIDYLCHNLIQSVLIKQQPSSWTNLSRFFSHETPSKQRKCWPTSNRFPSFTTSEASRITRNHSK